METEDLPTGNVSPQSSDLPADSDSPTADTMWTPVNTAGSNSPGDFAASDTIGEAEPDLRLDQNRAAHVDTDYDKAYNSRGSMLYRFPTADGHAAKQALRNQLDSLLPRELVQDAFGTAVAIDEVSSQHLAKLQGRVWRELPLMVSLMSKKIDDEVSIGSLIAVQSVCYIAELFSKSTVYTWH